MLLRGALLLDLQWSRYPHPPLLCSKLLSSSSEHSQLSGIREVVARNVLNVPSCLLSLSPLPHQKWKSKKPAAAGLDPKTPSGSQLGVVIFGLQPLESMGIENFERGTQNIFLKERGHCHHLPAAFGETLDRSVCVWGGSNGSSPCCPPPPPSPA